jgi:hypothetical protein
MLVITGIFSSVDVVGDVDSISRAKSPGSVVRGTGDLHQGWLAGHNETAIFTL